MVFQEICGRRYIYTRYLDLITFWARFLSERPPRIEKQRLASIIRHRTVMVIGGAIAVDGHCVHFVTRRTSQFHLTIASVLSQK
mmetsp:Transcript_15550/g.22167  ORF Transcript_15550/g.22167 Transcript_15550/m.22167 type:complete len:84 (-) Transcript_15550:18-269(-)